MSEQFEKDPRFIISRADSYSGYIVTDTITGSVSKPQPYMDIAEEFLEDTEYYVSQNGVMRHPSIWKEIEAFTGLSTIQLGTDQDA